MGFSSYWYDTALVQIVILLLLRIYVISLCRRGFPLKTVSRDPGHVPGITISGNRFGCQQGQTASRSPPLSMSFFFARVVLVANPTLYCL